MTAYPLQTLDEILSATSELDPLQAKGYVVCDRYFNRIKVKSPVYVAITYLKDDLSSRRLLEILLSNKSEEFLLHFPEWTEFLG